MTISSPNSWYQYAGNGVTTGFAFANIFISTSDLVVVLSEAASGIIHPSNLGGPAAYDYTITGTQDANSGEYLAGGTVVFNTAPPSGWNITIRRVVALAQPVALIDAGKIPAATVNTEFDRLTMIDQQMQEQINRTLAHPPQGGNYQANALPINNLATPVNPQDAVTKAYVDAKIAAGAAPSTYVDGIFVDTRGTGTADDTAIWTQALADAATLGLGRIYAARKSNVKNLNITAPIEIRGVHGQFEFVLAASAGVNDTVLNVRSSQVKLVGMTIRMPRYIGKHRTSYTPPGLYGIECETTTSFLTATQEVGLWLEDVTVIGGNDAGINVIAADRIDILNCEVSYCMGFGVNIGGEHPCSHVRINGLRTVACGAYGLSLAQIDNPPVELMGYQDIEITGFYAINCGKFYGFVPGNGFKFGVDLTTNTLQRLKFEGVTVGCHEGGVECKMTLPPPTGVYPGNMQDIDITCWNLQDIDSGGGVLAVCENLNIPGGSYRRIRIRGGSTFVGPKVWGAGQLYEIGDTVANTTDFLRQYICWGDINGMPGYSGNLGPPTGQGSGEGSFFDGNLYWEELSAITAQATLHAGVVVYGSGDTAQHGVTIENFEAQDCGYHTLIYPADDNDATIYYLRILNPIGRNLNRGIICSDNFAAVGAGLITGLHIINPDLEVTGAGPAMQIGAQGVSGSQGQCNVTDFLISGGKVKASAAAADALRFDGGTISGKIEGGAYFVSALRYACYVATATFTPPVITVSVDDATFENLGNGFEVWRSDAAGGTWQNRGRVQMIQPDVSQRAWNAANASPTAFYGQVIRGLLGVAPTSAGNLNERVEMSYPVSAATGRWDCTTAGGAGVAVWTAKP